jgi:hypothetical protein
MGISACLHHRVSLILRRIDARDKQSSRHTEKVLLARSLQSVMSSRHDWKE